MKVLQDKMSIEQFTIIAVSKYLDDNNLNNIGIGIEAREGKVLKGETKNYKFSFSSESYHKNLVLTVYEDYFEPKAFVPVMVADTKCSIDADTLAEAGVKTQDIINITTIISGVYDIPILLNSKDINLRNYIYPDFNADFIDSVIEYAKTKDVWSGKIVEE